MDRIIQQFHQETKLGRYFLVLLLSYLTCRKFEKIEQTRTKLKEVYQSNANKI
ncbi:hypothetical protein [Gracilibacillus oryzae]|uniref:hypothetical protein n=1 Tax=Gracilibacillus oryzae TaxID=1672701 RepID=UPI0012950A89|nr:hypothetical protein [Gracilibacillus oryzae]